MTSRIAKTEDELKRLLAVQAKRVMRRIGPLLDSWDSLPNDVTSLPELEAFRRQVNALYRAVGE
jgi:hypothetical protein